ncbi:hypothetical protein [Rhodovulum euryhalinum]|uniref:Uncharacterized protein n=1 Tax=Rhodovulum euryhalinum TaxID=35805 RepID=A0A4R2KI12_9RHOB|nr:hypothetical protein [Rhodovulum euryhalinum]TCO69638.1 hypothetical protein EV655_11490 [Rhodovulum euryhalinum]
MHKFFAIACVIGWGFFYAFSFLAVTSLNDAAWMPAAYAVLAFAGFLAGMLCWVRIVGGKRPDLKPVRLRASRRRHLTREIA